MKYIDFLKQQTDFICGQGATQSEIEEAEIKLNLSFALEYKDYLIAYSSAITNGHELTGICKQERMNVVSVTLEEWEVNPNVPHTMYVVERADIDGIILWQTQDGFIYQTQPGWIPKKIAESLFEYIQKILNV